MKAVIIEDVKPIQRLLENMLLESGVDEVSIASNGAEGLRYLSSFKGIDLLLLDIHLPDMSGLDVLKKIREKDSELFVVVVTGFEEPSTVQQIVSLGANRYLVKPVQLSDVKQVVTQCAASRK